MNRVNGFLVAASAAALLSACVVPPPAPREVVPRMAFPQAEYDALPKTGTGVVKGQAFMKTRGGDVKTAAGNPVVLNPVTSYSREWYSKAYMTMMNLDAPDSRQEAYLRRKTADASGRFTFENVPPGEYYVTTAVTWQAPTGYKFAMQEQGGMLVEKIVVRNGETVDLVMTR